MSTGKSKGKAPRKVIYNNEEFVAVRRDFLVEHPRVADRQEWECDRIRTQHGIHVEQAKSEPLPKPVDVFLELPFPDNIRQELQRRFQKPTPIQVQTWTAALQGCDLVGIAETGSGKTLAYVLPMLMHVNAQEDLGPGDGPIGLVLVPTQNLCHQVAKVLQRNAQTQGSGLKVLSGDSEDMLSHDEMRQRCHILVSTTGRFQLLCRERERRSKLK
jgi:ATP-dependent RNA helicase DDX5/DBP2